MDMEKKVLKKYHLYAGVSVLCNYFLFIVKDETGKIYFPDYDEAGMITGFRRISKSQYKKMENKLIKLPGSWKKKTLGLGTKMIFGNCILYNSKINSETYAIPYRIISFKKLSKKLIK